MKKGLFIDKAKELKLKIHPNRNNHIDFNKLTCGSDKQVYLECSNNKHNWHASAYDLTRKDSRQIKQCKFCKNGLIENHPWIVNYWDYKLNKDLPDAYTKGSKKYKFFICSKCKKSYESTINNITRKSEEKKCSVCANLKVTDDNSFASTTNKLLLKEFNLEKNELAPSEYSEFSTKRVHWKCSICNNEWDTTIRKRQDGNGCPRCNKQVSKPEIIVLHQLKTIFKNAKKLNINKNKYNYEHEIDIFVEEYKFGIEIDGRFHKERRKQDLRKNEYYKNKGIKIFRLREKSIGFQINEDYDIEFNQSKLSKKNLNDLLNIILKYIVVDKETKKRIYDYKKLNNFVSNNELLKEIQYRQTYIPNNLKNKRPDLLRYWDYSKNPLPPSCYTESSNMKVWWKCNNGHSYEQIVYKKAKRNYGCSYCSKSIKQGYNSVSDIYPNINEYLKNKDSVDLNKFGVSSSKQVEWINGWHSIRSFVKNFFKSLSSE